MSNLILLCRDCHEAVHDRRMAPVVRFHTNGSMSSDEFEQWENYWAAHDGLARFDSYEKCWYIPMADVKYLTQERHPISWGYQPTL